MKLNKEFITKFEELVEKENHGDAWMSPEEVSKLTGYTESIVVKILEEEDEFLKNKKGEYTTKKFYIKYTPFIKRFRDQLEGRIA